MTIPAETTIEFDELDVAAAHVAAAVAFLEACTVDIEVNSGPFGPITSTCTPDTALTQSLRDTILASIKSDDIRAPILTAFLGLKDMCNAFLGWYDCEPIP